MARESAESTAARASGVVASPEMPRSAPVPCRNAASRSCPNTTTDKSGFCPGCKPEGVREYDRRRGSARSRGYDSKWEKGRKRYLRAHPFCECKECRAEGRTRAATVVDHIIPHRGDKKLFWDENNWQAMSKPCHDRKTAKEDGGFGR